MKKKLKFLFVVVAGLVLALGVKAGYPIADQTLGGYHVPYYIYNPKAPVESFIDTSKLPPAQAVPILMYHGITEKPDAENTDLAHFVAQMETLKRNGYQTITLKQFDQFLDGTFTLPPKPFIITFDDGRKDSYYPTDDVFKKLGFTAVIFEVSGKANDREKFYLSWDELRRMRDSGRWEIESHGTYSHERVVVDEKGTVGRFLSSRKWLNGRLETEEEFKARIINDYEQNLRDLREQLGITAQYYAIPLNDYGYNVYTNYPESIAFNEEYIKKTYRLAFNQANDSDNVYRFAKGVYNYADADRWNIRRIEVKNMEPHLLLERLEDEAPRPAGLHIDSSDIEMFKKSARDVFGAVNYDEKGLHLSPLPDYESVRVLFGDFHWSNYTVDADIQRVKGRSATLLGYFKDDKNYISFGVSGSSMFLRERTSEKEVDLAEPFAIDPALMTGVNRYRLEFLNGTVTAYFNGKKVFGPRRIRIERGASGMKVWDDRFNGEGILKALRIFPSLEASQSGVVKAQP